MGFCSYHDLASGTNPITRQRLDVRKWVDVWPSGQQHNRQSKVDSQLHQRKWQLGCGIYFFFAHLRQLEHGVIPIHPKLLYFAP